jgi:hypothetical protein
MTFQVALMEEQGVTFAIVEVEPHVLYNRGRAYSGALGFVRYFPGKPIILMARDSRGMPTYWGYDENDDIVDFLSGLHISQIPLKEYTVN